MAAKKRKVAFKYGYKPGTQGVDREQLIKVLQEKTRAQIFMHEKGHYDDDTEFYLLRIDINNDFN